ncbi:FkbM family methyltransferase [Methylocystis sp. FS]|uniref:FkbM family methyltransferase n=1 Tax=Methylocystis silviterrae TaxID=2743612 RepID=UPI001583B47C|nr:FkbM family methyltransferase [Methylocystis silviterrae]NUJ81644.1 FkbM family methyltransferase [Methylocystis silviterrae]
MKLRTLHKKLIRRLPRHERLFTAAIELSGQVFRTPMINGSMCDVSEPWMVELLGRLLPARAGMFCDCGVNIGQTLIAVKAADPTRRYIGFEPNAECVAYVEKLIAVNRLSDVLIVPVGLAEATGLRKLQLYHGSTSDPSASLVEGFRPGEAIDATKLVPVMRFADVEEFVALPDLGLVKIDVEGAEVEVISSMRDALSKFKPWLIVEILPCYTANNVARLDRQRKIEAMMRDEQYVMFRIFKTQSGALHGLTEIQEIGIHGSLELSDYVFCPKDDVHALASAVKTKNCSAS